MSKGVLEILYYHLDIIKNRHKNLICLLKILQVFSPTLFLGFILIANHELISSSDKSDRIVLNG
jgi:hypothetical protein